MRKICCSDIRCGNRRVRNSSSLFFWCAHFASGSPFPLHLADKTSPILMLSCPLRLATRGLRLAMRWQHNLIWDRRKVTHSNSPRDMSRGKKWSLSDCDMGSGDRDRRSCDTTCGGVMKMLTGFLWWREKSWSWRTVHQPLANDTVFQDSFYILASMVNGYNDNVSVVADVQIANCYG